MDIAQVYGTLFDQLRAATAAPERTPAALARAAGAILNDERAQDAWPVEGPYADAPWRLLWALLIREAAVSDGALVMAVIRLELLEAGELTLEAIAEDLIAGADFHPIWITAEEDTQLPPSWLHAANATREVIALEGADLRLLVARPLADWQGRDALTAPLIPKASPRVLRLLDHGALEDYLLEDGPEGLRARALTLHRLGQDAQALEALEQAQAAGLEPLEVHRTRALMLREQERWDEAIVAYDAALLLAEPGRARAHLAFDRAVTFTEAEDLNVALDAYAQAAAEDPTWAEPWRNTSVLLMRLHRLDEALEAAARAASLDPENPIHAFNHAHVLDAAGDTAGALAALDRALELYPEYVEAQNNRALLRQRAGDLEGALADLNDTLERSDHPRARWNRASLLVQMERWADAYADLQLLLGAHPRDLELLQLKGRAAQALGLSAVATGAWLALLRSAEEPSPRTLEAEEALTALKYPGPHSFPLPTSPSEQAARAFLQSVTPEELGELSELLSEGMNALQADAPDAAVPPLEEATRVAPGCFEAWQVLAEALTASGRFTDALRASDKAIALAPEADSVWAFRSGIYAAQEDFPAALQAIDKAIERWPLGAEHHRRRGVWLGELGRTADALDAYQSAVDLQPDDADALYNLAALLQGTGAIEAAEATYTAVLELEPADVQALLNRGSARLALGREPEAVADWDRATALEPAFPHPWFKRGLLASIADDPWRALLELTLAALTAPEDWPFAEQLDEGIQDVVELLLEPGAPPAPAGVLSAFIQRLQHLGLEEAVEPLLESIQQLGIAFETPALA